MYLHTNTCKKHIQFLEDGGHAVANIWGNPCINWASHCKRSVGDIWILTKKLLVPHHKLASLWMNGMRMRTMIICIIITVIINNMGSRVEKIQNYLQKRIATKLLHAPSLGAICLPSHMPQPLWTRHVTVVKTPSFHNQIIIFAEMPESQKPVRFLQAQHIRSIFLKI